MELLFVRCMNQLYEAMKRVSYKAMSWIWRLIFFPAFDFPLLDPFLSTKLERNLLSVFLCFIKSLSHYYYKSEKVFLFKKTLSKPLLQKISFGFFFWLPPFSRVYKQLLHWMAQENHLNSSVLLLPLVFI